MSELEDHTESRNRPKDGQLIVVRWCGLGLKEGWLYKEQNRKYCREHRRYSIELSGVYLTAGPQGPGLYYPLGQTKMIRWWNVHEWRAA